MPKQFVKLFNNESLFQLTLKRNKTLCDQQFIISNTEQYFLATDQIEELNHSQFKTSPLKYSSEIQNLKFLLEPVGRNTAPAIALACFSLDPEEIVLVSSSDHLIKNEKNYNNAVAQAIKLAKSNNLVTFGITAKYPECGYGYIEAAGEAVKAFHEKPDLITAQKYLDAGNYYWNSGIFCFKAGLFLEELKSHAPKIYHTSLHAYNHAKGKEIIRISHEDMMAIPEKSIDYAVMENSSKVKVVISDMDWSDLGSFDAIDKEMPKDRNGNTLSEHLYTVDAKNNFVYSNKRAIALTDVEDLIVVDSGDALLITKKGASQKVKEVVKQLKSTKSELHHIHLTAHRPWGTYTILDQSKGYKIKRIVVKPGKRLSLQKHHHRSEHWIVINGTASVTNGTKTYTVHANESTYIPKGEIHRLENIGKIPLVMLEAQVGEYVGEDDIIRIEDDFKRMENE